MNENTDGYDKANINPIIELSERNDFLRDQVKDLTGRCETVIFERNRFKNEVEELKTSLVDANKLIFPNGVGEESVPQTIDRLRAGNAALKARDDAHKKEQDRWQREWDKRQKELNQALKENGQFWRSYTIEKDAHAVTQKERDRLKAENAALKKSGDELLKVAEMVIDISDKTPEDFDVDDVLTMVFAAAAAISKANRKKK